MAAQDLYTFFGMENFAYLTTEKQERFFEKFISKAKKYGLDVEESNSFSCLENRMLALVDQSELVRDLINHEIPYLFKEKVQVDVLNNKNEGLTFKCTLKIPYFTGPNCFIKDTDYVRKFKEELKNLIECEMKLMKAVSTLIQNSEELTNNIKTRPELITRLFV